jgi:FkbM family methyltransferase
MTVNQRRQASLAVAAFSVIVGGLLEIHDTPLIALTIAGVGMLWSTRKLGAWLMLAGLVGLGLFWSSLDGSCCSTWFRGRMFYAKAAGDIPYVAWSDVGKSMFSSCAESQAKTLADSVTLLAEKTVDGQKLEQYRTKIGDFWISSPGRDTISWMVWELTAQSDYESGETVLHQGDTVLDCGAHIGLFTRYALRRGAGRVISVEPDPTNAWCLRGNLAAEIAAGQVTLIEAGVWDSKTNLTLWQPEGNSGAKSFVWEFKEGVSGVPVLPIDDIVADLGLGTLDLVKMDIEGSERRALQGAKKTLDRFKPKMAICTYHRVDDINVIPGIVREARPDYHMHAKNLDLHWGPVNPKVIFFN